MGIFILLENPVTLISMSAVFEKKEIIRNNNRLFYSIKMYNMHIEA